MIRTILIDDEQHCIDRVTYLMDRCPANFEVLSTCFSVAEGIAACELHEPDLVFLDIEIQDRTGFDFLKEITEINFQVIFTTAFDNYAIKAFQFSALHYLLKPLDIDDFNEAIQRYQERTSSNPPMKAQMKVLMDHISNNDAKLSIPTSTGYEFIDIKEITRCEADGSYTHIFYEKSHFTVSKPLKHYDNLLQSYSFCRVHNSHLINMKFVKQYTKGKGGYITMIDGTSIDVSTRRKDEFIRQLNS